MTDYRLFLKLLAINYPARHNLRFFRSFISYVHCILSHILVALNIAHGCSKNSLPLCKFLE